MSKGFGAKKSLPNMYNKKEKLIARLVIGIESRGDPKHYRESSRQEEKKVKVTREVVYRRKLSRSDD